jgi:hypothetical protein
VQYKLRPIAGAWTDPVTPADQRRQSLFKATWQETLALLFDEVDWLGGSRDASARRGGLRRSRRHLRAHGCAGGRAAPLWLWLGRTTTPLGMRL